ncbi:uncharacterized protein [Chironomus tepperi]|uniref:uncharacterized protein n=1 Tax=Chironomus tepperi TaxID=113505 RepID=UPI00391FACD6
MSHRRSKLQKYNWIHSVLSFLVNYDKGTGRVAYADFIFYVADYFTSNTLAIQINDANADALHYRRVIDSFAMQNNVALKQQQEEGEQQQQKTATSGNENVKEVEEKSEGRAIKSNYYFPLSDFLTKAKAMQSNSYKNEKEGRLIVYPSYTQNIDQTRRRYDMTPSTGQAAQRRFAPGEAYGVTLYKLKHPEKFAGYKYPQPSPPNPAPQPMMMNPVPPPPPQPPMMIATLPPPPMMTQSPPSQQYLPPTDLHKFPPNLNAGYLPPEMMQFMNLYNSYVPPASGQLVDTSNSIDQQVMTQGSDSSANNDLMYIPPKDLNNFPPNINSNYMPSDMMKGVSLINSYTPPASGNDLDLIPPPPDSSIPIPPPYSMMNQQAANGGMQMNPGYIYNKPTGGDMMMPPTGMSGPSGPPMDDDHHHHHDDHDHHHDEEDHHHHHHPWDSYPDIYYDDHDHHHHHHHVEETTTTPAPVEPRVKKYSYYYLGRKLWYIPLYFTFWFCLYVAALIIRSIGRHKVDLPNHYVARSLHDMSHKEVVEKINKMTEFAMTQIEDFKNKYL